ncbi:MAG: sarcosine oxidase subunit gamma [Rhizobiaceae bacterium]|jgi:sarcosine oxidase subunit gamma|nr:sarcosine oxidase subunit gamma [Rhizobiaceae bacterium]
MAETASRLPVIAGARYAKGRASVSVAPPAARLSLRAPSESVAALSKALGVALPEKPKTSITKGDVHALWLGPDEWLLIGPDGHDFAGALAKVAAFHSAVDISHRNAALMVEGAGAADALNAGCPQDLNLSAFPAGACSRTLMGKTEIVLLRLAEHAFRVEVWRSFAPYAFDFLEDAIKRDW